MGAIQKTFKSSFWALRKHETKEMFNFLLQNSGHTIFSSKKQKVTESERFSWQVEIR